MNPTATIPPARERTPALPAALVHLPDGAVRLTIGRIVSRYNNAAGVRAWLIAKVRGGEVRLVSPEELPC